MRNGQVVLSKRLQMLADMVTRGNTVADVGCDHGFLSVYLVQNKISPHALAMDVREGPLGAAREHIESSGLNTYIETRLSDGLKKLKTGEARTLICAGMGGRLMERILGNDIEKARSIQELILQPQSEIPQFRCFLRREGFRIQAEDGVYEEGKYYFAMKAVYIGETENIPEKGVCAEACAGITGQHGTDVQSEGPGKDAGQVSNLRQQADLQDIYDEYGELLLKGRHPVLGQYLQYRRETAEKLLQRLEAEHTERAAERLSEVRRELVEIEIAEGWFER
ncbi:MAG: class I SAM-dependent methyltransferase [Firmicutes bacterium]|nr:class I SAM-dependent methyltransferase [Bacillota bacterium]